MKVNSINTFNYSNTNKVNNNRQYASRPVFKQNMNVAHQAIVDQFIESAKDEKSQNGLSLLKRIFTSPENKRKAEELKEAISNFKYDSTDNILYKI